MKELVLIAAALSVFLPLLVLQRVKVEPSKTLSQHISMTLATVWLGRVLIVLSSVLVLAWFYGWYVPTYGADVILQSLFVFGTLCATVIGVVPYYASTLAGVIHDIFSWLYVFTLPILLLYWSLHETGPAVSVCIVAALLQLSMLVLGLVKPASRNFVLYFQTGYIVLFGLTLVAITYL